MSISKKQHVQLAEYNFSEGMKEFVLEKYPQAQSAFEKALSLNPSIHSANYMLSKIFMLNGKYLDALNHIQKALKESAHNKYYHLQLANIYERQQNYEQAANTYKKLIQEIPGSEEHYYDLAACYIFQQNFEEALKAYIKVESLFGKSAELTKQKQQLFLKLNDFDKAVQDGQAYIEENPEDIDFQINQAEILYSNNKINDAIDFLEKLIKENPENGQARLLLIEAYKNQGKVTKSNDQLEAIFVNPEIDISTKVQVVEDLKKLPSNEKTQPNFVKFAELLQKSHPHDPKALIAAGDLFLLLPNKKEEAWREYIKAKNLETADFPLWNKIIQLDGELKQTDSLILHSEQALEVFPNHAVFWLFSGTGYQMKKEYIKAQEALEQGLKLSTGQPEIQQEFYLRLGDVYNEIKEYNKSDNAFDEVLKLDFDNEYVLNNYSYYLALRKEKLDKAKEMGERLVNKFPTNSTYLDTYAWVLYSIGNFEEARKYLEVAVSHSTNGTITEHYGDVLFKLGYIEKALEQWKKAKEMGETSKLLDKKIQDKALYEN